MRRYDIDDDVELRGGTWRRDGLVMRWEPDRPAEIARLIPTLIACPTCRARVTEACRTNSGHTTTPHGSRLAPRLCTCGARLPRQRRLCDGCRDEANRMNKKAWRERQREAVA